jgi:N-acyl homoserine lactone hydrolase
VPPPPQLPAGAEATTVLARLAELGLRPEQIDLLVCSRFDVDHVGYHDAFLRAELIVQREHYALARSGDPRFAAGRAYWDHPALRYRQVEGDAELLPGLIVVETSGHVLGHQSVLIHLPHTGPVLLAIDAVILERLFTPDRPASPMDADEERTRASTRTLLDPVQREHVALVVFGHDSRQWRPLKRSPSFCQRRPSTPR